MSVSVVVFSNIKSLFYNSSLFIFFCIKHRFHRHLFLTDFDNITTIKIYPPASFRV